VLMVKKGSSIDEGYLVGVLDQWFQMTPEEIRPNHRVIDEIRLRIWTTKED